MLKITSDGYVTYENNNVKFNCGHHFTHLRLNKMWLDIGRDCYWAAKDDPAVKEMLWISFGLKKYALLEIYWFYDWSLPYLSWHDK